MAGIAPADDDIPEERNEEDPDADNEGAAPVPPPAPRPVARTKRLAIIGGGPIGLELALAAQDAGIDFEIFEKHSSIAGTVESYHFVELFSPWELNVTEFGLQSLRSQGHAEPNPQEFPTGRQLVDQYLTPIAEFLSSSSRCKGMHFSTEVLSIGRGALLKGESIGGGETCMPKDKPLASKTRAKTAFKLLVSTDGTERYAGGFDFVCDCSGSYHPRNANWAGMGGVPAIGEQKLRSQAQIQNIVPDVLGAERARFVGRRTLLIGNGMSAATTARNLVQLAESEPSTSLVWLVRGRQGTTFSVIHDDILSQRKALCEMGNHFLSGNQPGVEVLDGAAVSGMKTLPSGRLEVTVRTEGGSATLEVDECVSLCGFRPDKSLYSELQVNICYATDGPIKLAATLIGGSGESLKQVAAGADTLKNPEPGFYILGMKSYGRNSSFLLKIGHEQVNMTIEAITSPEPLQPEVPSPARRVSVQEPEDAMPVLGRENSRMSAMSTASRMSCWSTQPQMLDAFVDKGEQKLGIDINYHDNRTLLVTKVNKGPVETYNRLNPDNEIGPGDRIMTVNGVSGDTQKMLAECKAAAGLQLEFRRAVERTITIEGQPGKPLGMDLQPVDGMTLLVTKIEEQGVISDHNKEMKDFAVRVSDRIIGVNDVRGNSAKLHVELQKGNSWTFTVRRIEFSM